MNPKDKRPDCCAEAGSAYDEGAIRWREAREAYRFSDLLAKPPSGMPRYGHGGELSYDPLTPAKAEGYEVVVDFTPTTEGPADVEYGDASFCPFCGASLLEKTSREAQLDKRQAELEQAADGWLHDVTAARNDLGEIQDRLRATAKRLRDEKGKDANNWPHTTRDACQCGSSGFRGPPTDPCPGCRVRDSLLEACAKLLDAVLEP